MSARKLFFKIYAVLFNMMIISVLLVGNLVFPESVHAMGLAIEVNTTADNTTKDDLCSLREAIVNANRNWQYYTDCTSGFSDDGIFFSDALGTATIPLSSALPSVTDSAGLNINGGGDITIDGQYYRIFYVDKSASLILDNLVVFRGSDLWSTSNRSGGCLYNNDGNVTIKSSIISSCRVIDFGGGIYSYRGSLTIMNSTFQGNYAGMNAPGNYNGGGIYNNGSVLTISDSTFSGNGARNRGGGIYIGYGTTTITNSTFSENGDQFINGGGIYAETGTLNVTKSAFLGNNANLGGGVYVASGTSSITNSTFSANTNSGVKNAGATTITNSTFSGNSDARLVGGGIANDGKLYLFNTILANTTSGTDCYNNPGGTVAGNNNLIEADSLSPSNCDSAALTGDPNLGTLSGLPSYFPLNSGSPAINAGDDAICIASPVDNTSQNGVPRYQAHSGPCDIGSYEVEQSIPLPDDQIEVLNKAVNGLIDTDAISVDNGKILTSMLDASGEALDKGDTTSGIEALNGFVDQVNALIKSEELKSTDGQPLIDGAQAIIDSLNQLKS